MPAAEPSSFPVSPAATRLSESIGKLAPRWGLPPVACCVHAYLFLHPDGCSRHQLCSALSLEDVDVRAAIDWLQRHQLIEAAGTDGWRTGDDPWELILRAVRARQQIELQPARSQLRDFARSADTDGTSLRTREQIGKLLRLADDFAAVDLQARQISPATLRRALGLGAGAARLADRLRGGWKNGR